MSEPALTQASLAVATKLWSPDFTYDHQAAVHRAMAVDSLRQRLQPGQALTDGVVGAIFTMAFGERLTGDDFSWNVHVDGLGQVVRERRSQGLDGLPPWTFDLLILFVHPSHYVFIRLTFQ